MTPVSNKLATASVTLGLIGFILDWIPGLNILLWFPFLIMGVLAIVFAGIGLSRAQRLSLPTTAATAGLVLGILLLIKLFIPVLAIL